MSNDMHNVALNLLNAAFWANTNDGALYLSASALEFVEDNLDRTLTDGAQLEFLDRSREVYDRSLELDIATVTEHTKALADLDTAREKAQAATRDAIAANTQLQTIISQREQDIERMRQQIEFDEKYQMELDRQEKRFHFLGRDAYRIYALAGLLVILFSITRDQSVLTILSTILGMVAQGYITGINSTFSPPEQEKKKNGE